MNPSGSWIATARRARARVLRRAGMVRPRVCFLVTARGDEDLELDETLHALRALPGADLVVVSAAPPGSGAARVAREHARNDWRVTATDADGWSPAVRATSRKRARHVVVLRPGDLPDPEGLRAALSSLGPRQSGVGSDLRLAVPSAALFDRGAWRAAATVPSVDVALAGLLVGASTTVRLAAGPVRRGTVSVVRGMPDTRPQLGPWLESQADAAEILATDPTLWAEWATSVLAGGAQGFLEDAERFDDDQWSRLQACVSTLTEAAGELGLARVPVEARVRAVLAAADRRTDLVDLVVARRFDAGQFATVTESGTSYAVLPVPDDLGRDLTALADCETGLMTSVRRLRWDGDELEMEVFAAVAGVDLRQHRPDIDVALTNESGRRMPVGVDLSADREVTRWMGAHHVSHDLGVVRLRVPLTNFAEPGRWRLEVTVTVAGLSRTAVVTGHDPGGSAAVLRPRRHGGLSVGAEVEPRFALVAAPVTQAPAPSSAEGDVAVDTLLFEGGRLLARCSPPDELEVVGPHGALAGHREGELMAWPLVHDPWGMGIAPAPAGRYVLRRRGGGPVTLTEAVTDRLPETTVTEEHRIVARLERRTGGAVLVLTLGPPLADDEVGPYCQHRLQEWYADPSHEIDQSAVYLQAYTGQHATDSPRAIAEELGRSRPDLAPTWAVADRSSRVPAGSATVLWRSRAWYAALARSRYVVTNIELEAWFRRRPGQEVLQTFHGYPSKAMGIGLWRSKRFTGSRIEQQLDRTSRNWTLLLTPTPEMDVHYRENYRYDGPILAQGYPRDDALVAPDADAVRAATRARLGISEATVAVLYAPTWRDDQALNFRSARLVDHLDVKAAAAALGPGHVLLLRGHRFMPAGPPGGGATVIDVTSYPEVNDLILAADVAVLDYSSMRFDFALTGRPMLFLVPDLDSYATASRGFLFDFAPTAPGPLLRSSAEVVEALRDLDEVCRRHREQYERFNATYNRFQDGAAARRTVARFFR